ncbi:glyoxylase-like metal-dependent hydrolase (beta-lactamase superfamily II) [Sedimentibacter acidaminivorans]|jgi:hydroxyacylglutathione hydrolase|uniref:Glyoxylase-like metal-dependent hydrolase (Beta-lactamase superfamily II) n=1 Tax=Sedimentibacter acidaminivorans TaxID=913099 RepID=A0ABS4GBF3_9FIRM|nr:MBL fold metallo-hydrolase [Sedimentibacter acidaminivorans]MBP1925007.1 glyoxylase-like metal-dependent hydrolase (beta-lactamase superfamily II) [Sedimentibacter acidaminivorans]
MIFEAITVGSYMSNCYILGSEKTKEAAIIDPGAEFNKIDGKIKELEVTPKMIILTHAHGDHIGAVLEFIEKYHIPVYIHEDDAKALVDSNINLTKVLFSKEVTINPDVKVKDGDKIILGDLEFEIIHTPGHTPGGISIKVENIMMTGDTLFNRSIGRTDFPGGSFDQIIDSIRNKIFKYDDETIVYPGHNSPTTIESEKIGNPFIRS